MTLVLLEENADQARVASDLRGLGCWTQALEPEEANASPHKALLILPGSTAVSVEALERVPGVLSVLVPKSHHPLLDALPRTVRIGDVSVGRGEPPVLAVGPCSLETEERTLFLAACARENGARLFRGGAFKPRGSPHSFQGYGRIALPWLARVAKEVGMPVVTEVISERDVEAVAGVADALQIGARSMHHAPLLRTVGATKRPVLLKRAPAATLEDWLLAAEHLVHAGCPGVVFVERGVRGFDPSTRNLLDIGAVAILAHVHGLPVMADPSHAAGRRDLVVPLGRAALAAGAHGLLIEVHDAPAEALSDGPQAIEIGPGALRSFLL